MKSAAIRTGFALFALIPLVSAASAQGAAPGSALDNWIIGQGDTSDSRKDVDQVSRPLPPSGPATPVPYCAPSAVECP